MIMKVELQKDPWQIYQELPPELKMHCENVAEYTKILYRLAMDEGLFPGMLSTNQLIHVRNAAIYHDIGKCVFEDDFLNKRGPFTPEERRWINYHVDFGLLIFGKTMENYHVNTDTEIFLSTAMDSIAHHHEHYDGSGYPKGIKGNDISPVGQMCCLCDYYDARVTDRSYHKAIPHDRLLAIIKKEKGKLFSPQLVDLFVKHQALFRNIRRIGRSSVL